MPIVAFGALYHYLWVPGPFGALFGFWKDTATYNQGSLRQGILYLELYLTMLMVTLRVFRSQGPNSSTKSTWPLFPTRGLNLTSTAGSIQQDKDTTEGTLDVSIESPVIPEGLIGNSSQIWSNTSNWFNSVLGY